jgi:threonine dehydrogenase-like Zn-dependent dehydrogenase
LLRLAGAFPVVACDLSAERLAVAERSGADACLRPGEGDPVAALRACNRGRRADVVIDVTGAPGSFPLATQLARTLGRVVLLGSPRGPVTVDLHDDVHTRGLQIIGSHASTTPHQETPHTPWSLRRNIEYFFGLLEAGRLEVVDLVSHRFGLSEAARAYAMLQADRTQAMGVLLQLDR